MNSDEKQRKLTRSETHDLAMIIKDRAKVLKHYAEEQAARCMADFEKKLATIYKYDQEPVWKEATEKAMAVVREAQERINCRCKEMGIPADLAPELAISWNGRGQMAIERRRVELRHVAKSEIEAMTAAAMTKIERQSVELRTQVVSMGLVTEGATLFLESLAPIEDTMRALDFGEIEKKLAAQKISTKRLGYGGLYD